MGFCIHCGSELRGGAKFCTKCGQATLAGDSTSPNTASEQRAADQVPPSQPAPRRWWWLVGSVALVAVVSLAAGVYFLSGNGDDPVVATPASRSTTAAAATTTTTPGPTTTTTQPPPEGIIVVRITNGAFRPSNLKVDLEREWIVQFLHDDIAERRYVIEGRDGVFPASPPLGPGDTYEVDFSEMAPGIYRYFAFLGSTRIPGSIDTRPDTVSAAETTTTAAPADSVSVSIFDLAVGDCFDDPDDFSEVSGVEIVVCASPHDNEVYHLFELPDGAYPGVSSVEASAVDGCLVAFEAFVGRAYPESQLDITYLYPSPETWDDGDREVVCSLYHLNGQPLTGSMRGSGI